MIILLEELVFAFAGFVGDDFAVVADLSSALLLRHVVVSLDFRLLLLQAENEHCLLSERVRFFPHR